MGDNYCSGRFRTTRITLFRASVYLVAVLGCALQSVYISQDYFFFDIRQRHTFQFSIPHHRSHRLSSHYHFSYEAKIGTTLKDLFSFSSLMDNVTVTYARIKEVGGKPLDLENGDKLDSYINPTASECVI